MSFKFPSKLESPQNMSSSNHAKYKVIGRMDCNIAIQIRKEIMEIIVTKPDTLRIEMKEVQFIDSTGLSLLVLILKKMRAYDGRLILCEISEQVLVLLEITSLDRLFELDSQKSITLLSEHSESDRHCLYSSAG